jgi:hypothetical protein
MKSLVTSLACVLLVLQDLDPADAQGMFGQIGLAGGAMVVTSDSDGVMMSGNADLRTK